MDTKEDGLSHEMSWVKVESDSCEHFSSAVKSESKEDVQQYMYKDDMEDLPFTIKSDIM